jgi:hypothetical protein
VAQEVEGLPSKSEAPAKKERQKGHVIKLRCIQNCECLLRAEGWPIYSQIMNCGFQKNVLQAIL